MKPKPLLIAWRFSKKSGLEPIVTPFIENGKGQHVKGFLEDFKQTARQATQQLEKLESIGCPIIGIDPAITLTYREEYRTYLDRQDVDVWLPQEWLANVLSHLAASLTQTHITHDNVHGALRRENLDSGIGSAVASGLSGVRT